MKTKYSSVALAFFAMINCSDGATISLSLNQTGTGGTRSIPVNLTTTNVLDWGIFTGDDTSPASILPNERMSGGVGFTSFGAIGGATNETDTFGNPARLYSWTNGTTASSGDSSAFVHDRLILGGIGAGSLLTIDVASAGTYQVVFYSTVFDVQMEGLATLSSGPTQTVNGIAGNGLQDFVWTVDFTTDAADTLTLALTKSGDTNNTYAIEAFKFSGIAVPEPSISMLIGLAGITALLRRR